MPECPSCGSELDVYEDAHGTVYQCHDMGCLSLFADDEIE